MRQFIIIALSFLLAACSAIATPPTEFDQALEKWQEADITHYRFELNYGCFCAFSADMPLIIEVQDGEVVSMEYASGKEIDPASLELFQPYATIDGIFAQIEKATNGGADQVTVTYDETYGYPTQVTIDFDQQMADEEIYLTISNFEVLP